MTTSAGSDATCTACPPLTLPTCVVLSLGIPQGALGLAARELPSQSAAGAP